MSETSVAQSLPLGLADFPPIFPRDHPCPIEHFYFRRFQRPVRRPISPTRSVLGCLHIRTLRRVKVGVNQAMAELEYRAARDGKFITVKANATSRRRRCRRRRRGRRRIGRGCFGILNTWPRLSANRSIKTSMLGLESRERQLNRKITHPGEPVPSIADKTAHECKFTTKLAS